MTRPKSPRRPIPPRQADRVETVCQFCNVGCSYTAFRWPVGREGGVAPEDNALGVDLRQPQAALSGRPYTAPMHTTIEHEGRLHNLALVPRASSVNPGCDHSSRGGAGALTTYSPRRPTRDRLKRPLLRVGREHREVSWAFAERLLATLLARLHDEIGPDALTAKAFDHGGGGGGFENNFAVGRLFFDVLSMKYVSIHNRPAYNSEVWGSRDRGVHELHSTAEDARLADTLVLWGANSFETASVYFTSHMLPNLRGESAHDKRETFAKGEPAPPTRIVIIDPRRTSTVSVCEAVDSRRVLHLRPALGTDVVLADAIARALYARGFADEAFLARRSDSRTFSDYLKASLQVDVPLGRVLAAASRITGVAVADIERAARWMAAPKAGGHRRRTLTLYEKGVIWNQRNYDTVAAVVQLSVLGGNIGRPGTGCSRQGGHQEGYVRPPYPGPRPPPNVDAHVIEKGGKLLWVVGTNPFRSAPNASRFRARVRERGEGVARVIAGHFGRRSLAASIVEHLEKTDDLFVVVNELYVTETARAAHLVLPAAAWGEMDLTSINCNSRRLRLYPRFMDPPGEARPDWRIMAGVARRMQARYRRLGRKADAARCAGFEWRGAEDVFLAGGQTFGDNAVDEAEAEGLPAECYAGVDYRALRELGVEGIQTPVRRDPRTGALVGTVRRYAHRFATPDGRFRWHGSDPWAGFPGPVARYLTGEKAKLHPFWLTTGRNHDWWQTGYHDRRNPAKVRSVPYPYVEVHPDDAERLGLEAGGLVELFNDEGKDVFQVRVLDGPPPGVLFALQYHPRGTSDALVSSYTDPKTVIPWYKGARVGLRRLDIPADAIPSLLPDNELAT